MFTHLHTNTRIHIFVLEIYRYTEFKGETNLVLYVHYYVKHLSKSMFQTIINNRTKLKKNVDHKLI